MRTARRLVRRAVRFELGLYRSLLRWVTRRPDVPEGHGPFSYVHSIAAILWAFIGVSTVEPGGSAPPHPLGDTAVHRRPPRPVGSGLDARTDRRFTVYPHLVGGDGLRVRHGAATDITVPWEAIAAIAVRERSRDGSKAVQLDKEGEGTVLNVVIASRTNIDVTLHRPLLVRLPSGAAEEVTEVRLLADEPRALVSRVRDQPDCASHPLTARRPVDGTPARWRHVAGRSRPR